jgi:hypothetical protein
MAGLNSSALSLLRSLPAFSEAVGVDRDVCLTVEKLFFTIGANLALDFWNLDASRAEPGSEGLSHPPDAAATTRGAA